MQWIEVALTWPFAEIVDGGQRFVGLEPESRTMLQIATDYSQASPNQETRTISVRMVYEWSGAQTAQEFTLPLEPPAPLEHLFWNSGNPMYDGTAIVDVLDENDAHFWALNPENWDMARALADYAENDVCANKTPHEIQARHFYGIGSGPFQTFTVPAE